MIKMPMTFAVVVVKRVISTLSLNSKQTHLQADKDNMLNTTTKYPTKSQKIHIEYFRRASRFCFRFIRSSLRDSVLKSVDIDLSATNCVSSVEAHLSKSSIPPIFQKIVNNFGIIELCKFVGNFTVFANSVCNSPRRSWLMQNLDQFRSWLFSISFPNYAHNGVGVFAFQCRLAKISQAVITLADEVFSSFFYCTILIMLKSMVNRWNYWPQFPSLNLIETRVNKCVTFEQRKAESVRNVNQFHKLQWSERCIASLVCNFYKSVRN